MSGVHGAVPRPDRARAADRRDAPQPRPRAEQVPARAGDAVQQPGAQRQLPGQHARRMGRRGGVQELAQVEDPSSLEIIYWVGCMSSFDARNQRVATALAKIFAAAGVRFAILGREEGCSGDPRGAPATSTCSRSWRKPTSSDSTSTPPENASSPVARIASTRSRTSTRSLGATTRSSTTASSSRSSSSRVG